MKFRAYPKIHRLGKEETDGILDEGVVVVQEKVDGANTSIWIDDGVIKCGSRTRELPDTESFNGFVEWVRNDVVIADYLRNNPTHTLYGEWLVRHTIAYNETSYKKWYLYDILTEDGFMDLGVVVTIAKKYGFDYPTIFAEGVLTLDEIKSHVGKTTLGEHGEGIVLKRFGFVNKFGDHCYAKIVTEKFKEDNGITFGGNNKHSEVYQEMYFVNKYCTLARVQKIMNKLQPEIDKRLDLEHIPRISSTCYHDMITEEGWEIAKAQKVVDFKALQRLSIKKFIQIYKDIITGDISVADREN